MFSQVQNYFETINSHLLDLFEMLHEMSEPELIHKLTFNVRPHYP